MPILGGRQPGEYRDRLMQPQEPVAGVLLQSSGLLLFDAVSHGRDERCHHAECPRAHYWRLNRGGLGTSGCKAAAKKGVGDDGCFD